MPTALVLTGGGARGAYQTGALAELLPVLHAQGRVPSILCGASVGALNAAALAVTAHLPVEEQVGALVAAWSRVEQRDVLRPFVSQVPRVLRRYLSELSPFPGPRLRGLIDTGPLRATLEAWVDWDRLHANIGADAPIRTLSVVATEIATGQPTAFVAGQEPESDDAGVRHVSTRLSVEHLVASASIPLLFEATHVDRPDDARGWYADGTTRLMRPVTLAIDAGADDVVVVSPTSLTNAQRRPGLDVDAEPDLADVLVNVLDALMRDVLVDDLERVADRVSCTVVGPDDPEVIGELARDVLERRHRTPLALLGSDFPLIDWALGGGSPRQAELLSFLLFDPEFIRAAMDRGAADARAVVQPG